MAFGSFPRSKQSSTLVQCVNDTSGPLPLVNNKAQNYWLYVRRLLFVSSWKSHRSLLQTHLSWLAINADLETWLPDWNLSFADLAVHCMDENGTCSWATDHRHREKSIRLHSAKSVWQSFGIINEWPIVVWVLLVITFSYVLIDPVCNFVWTEQNIWFLVVSRPD